jgi:hypothetical protein
MTLTELMVSASEVCSIDEASGRSDWYRRQECSPAVASAYVLRCTGIPVVMKNAHLKTLAKPETFIRTVNVMVSNFKAEGDY